MNSRRFHLGLRQAVMALMDWAIDVPQKLSQNDAKPFFFPKRKFTFLNFILIWINYKELNIESKEELIIKKSYIILLCTDCHL